MTLQDTAAAAPDLDPALRAEVVEHICAVLPRVLKRESVEASADSTLMESLGMGSTSALELVLELEEAMAREISIEDLGREHFQTVGTLADYVAGNLLPEDDG
ncbi:phosphopantetheine-binding protein [Actinospica durhamensis]|uniref:Phosphopantetheine-binding protein n=1 Tax=Actinospica durhamensis TaxID=1508375 RepID=A0A941IUH0_9ACTN|nr:phosphopantetheine-binding protein [Actinospica durhamensis]MBR7835541.1 phosphopantetheine-binding protein [Actinospica durhamensis]